MRWIHREEIVESVDQCIALDHTLTEATSDDSGEHVCEVSYADGTVATFSAGTLEVVGECSI